MTIFIFKLLSYVFLLLWLISFVDSNDHLAILSFVSFWLTRQSIQIEKLKEKIK